VKSSDEVGHVTLRTKVFLKLEVKLVQRDSEGIFSAAPMARFVVDANDACMATSLLEQHGFFVAASQQW
jgi:hypothetical protein